MVVGWSTIQLFAGSFDDQEVAVLDAGDELDVVIAQVLVQVLDELGTFLCGEVSAMMVLDFAICQADDVASHRHVARLHVITDGGGFKRTSAFIHLVHVVTQYGGVGYLGTRVETLGHREQSATSTRLCQQVHRWGIGILHRGLPTQSLHGVVCHAVT